ncbi:hypothetical protein BV22DRAFT_260133 [Leucogyrophana mollusca]|uniref:Uncharacterized protein n=1 Tax=Leucogyrophana mollusca TaxID=85980 RepID=A0ACB8BRV6_9AGAM|nr:hypothetical protein BV22DRAFT_260133 [Leucogyrophana mollusca]
MSTLSYHFQIVQYCKLAPGALWILEYLLTFDDELRLVWSRRCWNLVDILFVLTRYVPITELITANYNAFAPHEDTQTCTALSRAGVVMRAIATIATEMLLFLRTLVLLHNRKTMKAILMAAYVAACLVIILCSAVILYMGPTGSCPSRVSAVESIGKNQWTGGVFTGVTFFELAVVIATGYGGYVWPASDLPSGGRLMGELRQGNLVYSSSLLVISGVNVVFYHFPSTFEGGWLGLFHMFQLVLHGVVGSRIMFGIREADKSKDTGPARPSQVEFASIPPSIVASN